MLQDYISFFTASSQASATLLGLLFVVMAVDTSLEKDTRIKQYIISENAFFSLGAIFIISLIALLPEADSFVLISATLFAVIGAILLVDRSFRYKNGEFPGRDVLSVGLSILAYLVLAAVSVIMLWENPTSFLLDVFCADLALLFILSLIRAWRTLLITKHGLSK